MPKSAPSRHLQKNFRVINAAGHARIETLLRENYFRGRFPPDYLTGDRGKNDLADHLDRRLANSRATIIPWLESNRLLRGASILEVGCGTGCSTVALAEQGAHVVALDIDELSLRVAQERCHIYGLDVEFVCANAKEIGDKLTARAFDYIMFYASLEHMTHEERIAAMSATWQMLSSGSLWCVFETPNRLWYHDAHTSHLPFHMWLPDELAFHYSRFSSRENYCEQYRTYTDEWKLHFLRRGRGVSFHEFEIAMKPAGALKIKSSLKMRDAYSGWRGKVKWRRSDAYRYISILRKMAPQIDEAFFQQQLDLIIEKD